MPTLTRPKADVFELLADVMARFHGPLERFGVTVGLLAAWPNEGEGNTLKLHGYPCAAVVKVTPYRQRVQGIEDAVITLDGPTWNTLSEPERTALLDHELQHLEVSLDNEGNPRSDDHGRPKLKVRLHDWQLGGFDAIAARHKAAALEVQAFRQARDRHYQSVFAWGDDSAGSSHNPDESTVTLSAGGKSVTVTGKQFSDAARAAESGR